MSLQLKTFKTKEQFVKRFSIFRIRRDAERSFDRGLVDAVWKPFKVAFLTMKSAVQIRNYKSTPRVLIDQQISANFLIR